MPLDRGTAKFNRAEAIEAVDRRHVELRDGSDMPEWLELALRLTFITQADHPLPASILLGNRIERLFKRAAYG